MDLMTLAAKLTLDDSAFNASIDRAEGKGKQFASSMKASAVAIGNFLYDAVKAGVGKIEGVIGGAIDSYADYQQLIGGVETLFKSSADKVSGYAKESFRTTGLSANDYMQTVTAFSASLIQGLSGDTEQAAEIANMAVTDMADNANKMGTDITSIQNAYQGFAKKNYTMLDNLKLGYGGTAAEMVRLINDSGILDEQISDLDNVTFDQMIKAIHQIQTNLEITGTTAKEAAETISGSKSSLGAAWKDLLSAVGGEGDEARLQETVENFKTSFQTYLGNFIPTLATTIANSDTLVEAIAESIAAMPTDLLTKLGSNVLDSGAGIVTSAGKVVNWLIDSLVDMFKNVSADPSEVEKFGTAIGEFIGTTIANIAKDLPAIVGGIWDFGVALSTSLIDGLFSGLFGNETERQLDKVGDEFTESVTNIELSAARSEAILNYMQQLVDKEGEGAKETEAWAKAQAELEESLGGSKEVFDQYGDNVQGAIDKLREMNAELRKQAILKALEDRVVAERELLGEAVTKKANAQIGMEQTQSKIKVLEEEREASYDAYAEQLLKVFTEGRDTTGWTRKDYEGFFQANDWGASDLKRIYGPMFGNTFSGEGIRSLYFDVLDRIYEGTSEHQNRFGSALANYYQYAKTPEEQTIYGKSALDYILDPEVLAGLSTELTKLNNEYKDYDKQVQEANDSISQCNEAIERAERALELGKEEIENSTENESKSREKGASDVEAGLAALKGKFLSFQLPVITFKTIVSGNENDKDDPQNIAYPEHAAGLDTVPFDGYKAVLHRNEAVLTAKEADAWRKGGMNAELFAGMISDAIEESMSKVAVMMSGEKVGDMTTKRVRNNIKAYDYARTRAMGG